MQTKGDVIGDNARTKKRNDGVQFDENNAGKSDRETDMVLTVFCDYSWKYVHCSMLGMSFKLPMIGSPGGPGGRCLLREPRMDERMDNMASDMTCGR